MNPINEETFFIHFNLELFTNLKEIYYNDFLLKKDFTAAAPTTTTNTYLTYLISEINKFNTCNYFNISPVQKKFNNFEIVLDTYKVPQFTIKNNDNVAADLISFIPDYLSETNLLKLMNILNMNVWMKMIPKFMLYLCQRIPKSLFFYYITGYSAASNTGIFEAPIYKYDNMDSSPANLICSLRKINSNYKGAAIRITDGNNKATDIGFDKDTRLIDYNQILNFFNAPNMNTLVNTNKTIIYISRIYNQTNYLKRWIYPVTTNSIQLVFKYQQANHIYIPTILYKNDDGKIDDYITLNFSSGDEDIFNGSSLMKGTFFVSFDTDTNNNNSIVSLVSNRLNTEMVINPTQIQLNYYDYDGNDNFQYISKMTAAIDRLSNFKTISIIKGGDSGNCDDKSSSSINISTNSYLQKEQNINCDDNSVKSPLSGGTYIQVRNGATVSEILLLNELLDKDTLNKLSSDNYNVWNTFITVEGPDKRCDYMVDNICKTEINNPICACYNEYTTDTNTNVNYKNPENGLLNDDIFCRSALCASSFAYKNKARQKASLCNSINSSSINVKPSKYTHTDINNVQINNTALSGTNINNVKNLSNICSTCKENEKCVPSDDNNTKGKCIPKVACTNTCNKGYTCVIGKDLSSYCVKSSGYTKCKDSSTCSKGEYCSKNFGVCIEDDTKKRVTRTVEIGFGIAILFLSTFFVYKKIKKYPLYRKNDYIWYIMFIIISIIISLLYYFISKKSYERYSSVDDKNIACNLDSDCKNRSNNICNNNNLCVCKIGYNTDQISGECYISDKEVCTSISILPQNVSSYYYHCLINNSFYAFSYNATFKFNGNVWIEMSRNSNQSGYNPYVYLDDSVTNDSRVCCTIKQIVYMLVFNSNGNYLLTYNSKLDTDDINKDIRTAWTKLNIEDLQSSSGSLQEQLTSLSNNSNQVVLATVNSQIYIFGGVVDGNNNIINSQIFILDTSDINNITISSPTTPQDTKMEYTQHSKAFNSLKDNDVIFLICKTNQDKNNCIYKYSIQKNTYNPIHVTDDSILQQFTNITYEYINDIEYINIYYGDDSNKFCYVYDITSNKESYKTYQIPKGISNKNYIKQTMKQIFKNTNPPTTFYSIIKFNEFEFIFDSRGHVYRLRPIQSSSYTIVPCYGVSKTSYPRYSYITCSADNCQPPGCTYDSNKQSCTCNDGYQDNNSDPYNKCTACVSGRGNPFHKGYCDLYFQKIGLWTNNCPANNNESNFEYDPVIRMLKEQAAGQSYVGGTPSSRHTNVSNCNCLGSSNNRLYSYVNMWVKPGIGRQSKTMPSSERDTKNYSCYGGDGYGKCNAIKATTGDYKTYNYSKYVLCKENTGPNAKNSTDVCWKSDYWSKKLSKKECSAT